MASKDNLLAVKSFFQRFPERAQNGYFLASESYGGHYIPQWTLQVLNDPAARVHFQGYLLGAYGGKW
jgi:carboxypeptidase C (cathepsin A)